MVAPVEQSANIFFSQKTLVAGSYTTLGSLQVAIFPADAVNLGARWRVDDGPWQTDGAIVDGLTTGNHTVSFNTIFNWLTPTNRPAVINYNQTTAISASYTPLGSLQVSLGPPAAVSSGAQWRVDGGTWQTNGATIANLALGNHAMSFLPVDGWITP